MSWSSLLSSSTPAATLRYAIAILAVAVAVVAGLLVNTFLQSAPFVSLFLCAIMFAAWFGGAVPGLLATALSIFAFDHYFVPPIHSLVVEFGDVLR